MSVLAIVPARAGSKGIPHKNFRDLAGNSPIERAIAVGMGVGAACVVSTDHPSFQFGRIPILQRPPTLALDDTPMVDVIKHVLSEIPGPPDQIIVLLQPTQPLRTPEHITKAITLLRDNASTHSVVSVTTMESPDKALLLSGDGSLWGWDYEPVTERRQDATPAYRRDGTVYAFYRRDGYYHLGYGCVPLIIDPADTCALDTPEEWAEAERRLRSR